MDSHLRKLRSHSVCRLTHKNTEGADTASAARICTGGIHEKVFDLTQDKPGHINDQQGDNGEKKKESFASNCH